MQAFAQTTVAITYEADGTVRGTVTSDTYVDSSPNKLMLFNDFAPEHSCLDVHASPWTVTNGVYRFEFSALPDGSGGNSAEASEGGTGAGGGSSQFGETAPPAAFAYGSCSDTKLRTYATHQDFVGGKDYYFNQNPLTAKSGSGLIVSPAEDDASAYELSWETPNGTGPFQYNVNVQMEAEDDPTAVEETSFGPLTSTSYVLDTSTLPHPPAGPVTISVYDTETGVMSRLYGNDLLNPMNTPVSPDEDIRSQTKATVDLYDNGQWVPMPDITVQNQFAGLYSAGYVTADTSVQMNLVNAQGSMDMEAYKDRTFRITYEFGSAPFHPGVLSTLDFDTQFAPNGWTFNAETGTLQLFLKPAHFEESDDAYWNVYAGIYQTGGSVDPDLDGSTLATFHARSSLPEFITKSNYQDGAVASLFSDAGNAHGNVKWYLPVRLLNSLHIYQASEIALNEWDPEQAQEAAVPFEHKDDIVQGTLEGTLIETEPGAGLTLPTLLVVTKNLAGMEHDDLAIMKSLVKDEMYFDHGQISPEAIDAAGSIPDLLKVLNDRYTYYFTKEEYAGFVSQFSGNLGGIGITMGDEPSGIKVVSILPGSPAAEHGLQPGDLLTAIDGKSLEGILPELRLLLMRGEVGEDITLTVVRGNEVPFTVTMTRANIFPPVVDGKVINDHTIHLTIHSFTNNLPQLIGQFMNEKASELDLSKSVDLILDLRDNGGGDANAAFNFLQSAFAQGTPLIQQESKNKSYPPIIYGRGTENKFSRIVLLDNENTASASEITSVALKDNGAALLGKKTYGKGISQVQYMFPDGSAMKFTDAKFTGTKGTEYNHIGLLPNLDLKNLPNEQWIKLAEMLMSSPADQAPKAGDLRITLNDQAYDIDAAWFYTAANQETAKQLLPLVQAPDSLSIYNGSGFESKSAAEVMAFYGLLANSDSHHDGASTESQPAVSQPVAPAETKPGTPKVEVRSTITMQKMADGTQIPVAEVDKADVLAKLSANREVQNFLVTVDSPSSGAAKLRMPTSLLAAIADNNAGSTFTLQTGDASYQLPAALLLNPAVKAQLQGLDPLGADTSLEVQVIERKDTVLKQGKLVSKVAQFDIVLTSGTKQVQLDDFGKQFVNRTLALDANTDTNHAVGVLVNADGTVSPVPTQFVAVDGKKVAKLMRNGNSAYAVIENDTIAPLADVAGHWAESNIRHLADKLIVTGYADQSYQPERKLTRAEYMALLGRSLGFTSTPLVNSPYSDVHERDWFSGLIPAVTATGLMNGYEDSTFRGGQYVSREEAVVLMVRALELFRGADMPAGTAPTFKDEADISAFAKAAVGKAMSAGLVQGKEGERFEPHDQLTRAEAAVLIDGLVQALANSN
ncbi:S-layer homology domain-containing protein [Paenibacillus aestuarii]